jgi:thiol-disulfide isomerase/thioredoxin
MSIPGSLYKKIFILTVCSSLITLNKYWRLTMKKIYVILVLMMWILLPAFSIGKTDETKAATVAEETAVPAESSEPLKALTSSEITIKLNQAGFDTPTEVLPSIDFELSNLKGLNEKLSDYKGQVVFLNFWATWCGPCKSEMPSMEIVYNKLKDKGFVILAVDLGEDQSKVQKFVDEYKLTFPVVLDETNAVGSMYNAQSIPTTYLIDRDGNILGRAVGARPWDEEQYMKFFTEILNM